jgi:DNA-binding NtrC family response regulator
LRVRRRRRAVDATAARCTSRTTRGRILAATSKNLLEEIEKGRFRDDLYDRPNVVNIALPPLRARREDVPLLAEHYLRLASAENGFKPKKLIPRATGFLSQLPWRGNVRELRNLMERLAVIVSRDGVTHRDVMEALHMTAPPAGDDGAPLSDGKTPTATVSGRDGSGAAFDQVIVFDRK